MTTKKPNLKKIFLLLIALGFVVFISFFIVTSKMIGNSVRYRCQVAQEKYGGDCVASLIKFLEGEENSFLDRNSAIWALGQMGDSSAVPVLEKYFTGVIPDREPLDLGLSQYELSKAIKLARGGLNLTHFVWKR